MRNKFDEIFEKAGYEKLKVTSFKRVKEIYHSTKKQYKTLLKRLKD